MPFDPVDPKQSFPELEEGILGYWREEDIFKRSIRNRTDPAKDARDEPASRDEVFSFYDGPPFATGLPHYGHLLAGTIKDVIPRYQTMKGKAVQRRFGWDCHGLPVEYEIEKEHGIASRKEIDEMGVAKFNALCRAAVQRYTKEWRVTVERMGRWVDMDWDYRTMDPDFMESIWWVFSELQKKGLIYEGHKPMHICPRCVTALSNFEVTQGYKEISDYSVYVKLELEDEPGTHLLIWTTTAWTLPGNVLAAVHPDIKYVKVRVGDERLIVAKDRADHVFGKDGYTVEKELKASELIGRRYKPLFPYFAKQLKEIAFRVVGAPYVTTDTGTGVVHLAPAFGEEDFYLGKEEGVPLVQHVGMDGKFIAHVTDFAGKDAKPKDNHMKGDNMIADWLQKHGKLFKAETFKHTYPHCWRCDSPLLNYATSSWFVAVEKIKEDLLMANAQTEWVPAHIRDGRFGKWLIGARDWAISRNRYWGTPLPIWRSQETGEMEVIGGRDALMERKKIRFTKVTVLRHAQSEGNMTPVYQGKLPGTDLTVAGKKQAKRAGKILSVENVSKIYASPLNRTKQTAELVAKETDAEVEIDERIREVAFGEYEGKTVDFNDLTFVKARRAHKLETGAVESIYHFPGMETWSQVEERTSDFLKEILPKHRGEHIVIVTHADPALTIKHFFGKEDPLKLNHQPYPRFADPQTFYYDHDTGAELDLHKETVDDIAWAGGPHSSSVEVTLVRHGQTDYNAKNIEQGSEIDAPLNETGREQAWTLAKKLKGKKFDVLICSPMKRALETAEIMSKELELSIAEKLPVLRERSEGDWTGKTEPEVLQKFPTAYQGIDPSMHHLTPKNGESLSDFFKRAEEASAYLREKYAGKKVLLVAHGGFMMAFRTVNENASYQETVSMLPKNAETVKITLNPLLKRIPDVLDCWFESGSMPYAQSHYPFSLKDGKEAGWFTSTPDPSSGGGGETRGRGLGGGGPPGFPADFIAEGIDQTRGWFYTLTVLAAALFKKPAFEHCVVNGTVLAEDGKKMSKRLKNYPEPLAVAEKHGADAVRFALMSSPAVRGEDMRFSERLVEETLRNVLLPLWNTYAFFVTYANAAEWEPTQTRAHSKHPLDQWIRAEVQDLVNRMTKQLDSYDLSATCNELNETIDALTNWYVRLSRRRFAGKSSIVNVSAELALRSLGGGGKTHEQDQEAALQTLYDVLITLSQLLAPFTPFITDAMYLNLVSEANGSVHLTDWPETRALSKAEQEMIAKTRVLRTVVSISQRIRSEKKIKVRQPLEKAVVAIPRSFGSAASLSPAEIALLQEELNVKTIELVDDPGSLAKAIVQVDARKAGPRLGARVQEVIQAGKRGDFTQQKDGMILILEERLGPDEAKIVFMSDKGGDIGSDRGIVVSLDCTVNPALKLEGQARDLIRAIQQLRKDAGLEMQDKIGVEISGADEILSKHTGLIEQETNSAFGKIDGDGHEVNIDEKKVIVRFAKK
ncbi:class I tRNA ligase family protein [Candidatus Peregrinibacteria bacterium]|nr:class I tRNA ligase family protein [Candidatus Peregrinibacteria bacterium]